MGTKAFEAIAAGIADAIAYSRGDKTRGRLTRVRVAEVNVSAMREKLGLSQEDFAHAFGVSPATVRNWEQGRRRPQGPARVLLKVIDKAPGAVLGAIGVSPRHRGKRAA